MNAGKIIVRSSVVVTAKVGAKQFEVTNQQALFETPDGSRNPITVGVDPSKGPWPVGEYELSADSFHVDKYGRLEVRPVLVLVPIAAAKPVARSA